MACIAPKSCLLGIFCLALSFLSGKDAAAVTPAKAPTQQSGAGDVRIPQKSPRVARVRIALKLTPYDKMLVKNEEGVSRIVYRPIGTMRHMLRARIERPNHFYIGNWHVETVPVAFKQDSLRYEVKLRLFKRYGEGADLEEMVGSIDLAGVLKGDDYLYVLYGKKEAQFKDRIGNPVVDVIAGFVPEEAQKPLLSRSETRQPEGAKAPPARSKVR